MSGIILVLICFVIPSFVIGLISIIDGYYGRSWPSWILISPTRTSKIVPGIGWISFAIFIGLWFLSGSVFPPLRNILPSLAIGLVIGVVLLSALYILDNHELILKRKGKPKRKRKNDELA